MLVSFGVLMVCGSTIHTLWTARGLAMKFCYGSDDVGCRALLPAVNSYWSLAYNIGAVPGFLPNSWETRFPAYVARGTQGPGR
jgi:hypothetical protein